MMMDYNQDNSDHDAHSSNTKDNVGEEEDKEDPSQGDHSVEQSQIKSNGSSNNEDPLTQAFNSFHTLQEVLTIELEKLQQLGIETISSLHNGAESSSCIHGDNEASSSRVFGSKSVGEMGLASLDSEILTLVNNVEVLEIKLVETKSLLEVKESQIRELESSNTNVSEPCNQGTEISIEEIFQQKIEAEVENIIFSRSVDNLNKQITLIKEEKTLAENEAHKMLSKLGQAETKVESLKNQAQDLQNHCVEITDTREVKSFKKRVFETTSCLLLQLGFMFMLFNFQLNPESDTVVPT